MKILLVTRGKYLKHPEKYFNSQYQGIKTIPILAGGFGWFWAKALAELGHEVMPFIFYNNPTLDCFCEINQFIERCKYRFSIFNKLPVDSINRRLIRAIQKYKPELILIDAGNLIYPETLREIKKISSAKIVNWLLDDPIRQRWDNVVKSMDSYDFVFICDRGLLSKFSQMGASFIDYLPAACDADIHRVFTLNQQEIRELASELCFIGTVTAHRVDFLQALSEFGLSIWSFGKQRIKDDPILKNCYRGLAWGEQSSKIFNAAKIVFNIHHPQAVLALNMRGFEIAGCGAFQLVDKNDELNNLFQIGREIICYNGINELKELVKYYLSKPQERQEIAMRAQGRAHREHTYKHRLSKIISTVEKL